MRLSISKIKCFKSCRRMYELKYVEGLEPVQKADALELGSNYHKLLEELNNGVFLEGNPDYADDFSKEMAMAIAYERYIFPHFRVNAAEKWVTYDLGDGDTMVGIVDAIADDGHVVEHKTTSMEITERYEYDLLWDEQILAYMLMTGNRKVWYTICRKPTIRQTKNETEEEFFHRMLDWFDVDTDKKIRLLEIERTDEEVEEFRKSLGVIKATMQEAEMDKNFYKNTCHCNMWGRRCEYSSICLHYDPNQDYIEFVKGGRG